MLRLLGRFCRGFSSAFRLEERSWAFDQHVLRVSCLLLNIELVFGMRHTIQCLRSLCFLLSVEVQDCFLRVPAIFRCARRLEKSKLGPKLNRAYFD